jgi:mannose-6-phosphate isomerase-like protein (cupin superfamily)
MHIIRHDRSSAPLVNATGEEVYPLLGAPADQGGAAQHSLAYVVIPPGKSSLHHYHPQAEESYYILRGQARMVIDGQTHTLQTGDAILIQPPEPHQIFSTGDVDLVFIVACAPPWTPDNAVYLDSVEE